MEEENNKETNVKSTIDAVTGLVKAVPVYQDTIQPAAKEIGKSLETVSKTVNIALAPIKALVWGYEKIEDFISTRVSEKLQNVPEKNIITPKPEIAGPTIEALRFTGHNEELRELYANLLATSMDKNTLHKAHPSYVEVIKGLSTDEARLLKIFINGGFQPLIDLHGKKADGGYVTMVSNFSNLSEKVELERPDLIPNYIDNLCRLTITEIPYGVYLTKEKVYEKLENHESLSIEKLAITNSGKKIDYERKVLKLTNYGKQFIDNVVVEK